MKFQGTQLPVRAGGSHDQSARLAFCDLALNYPPVKILLCKKKGCKICNGYVIYRYDKWSLTIWSYSNESHKTVIAIVLKYYLNFLWDTKPH